MTASAMTDAADDDVAPGGETLYLEAATWAP